MIIVRLPDDPLTAKAAVVWMAVKEFFRAVPTATAERYDRRRFRWVLCGEHGFVRNFRERCPDCGGYAEPLRNHVMAKRLAKRRTATLKLLRPRHQRATW